MSCHSLIRRGGEVCCQSVGGWVWHWTMDRVYLGCCQTLLRWKLRNGRVFQRHLKNETHSWKSSGGHQLAKYSTLFLCMCFCCDYTTAAYRLFTWVWPVLNAQVCGLKIILMIWQCELVDVGIKGIILYGISHVFIIFIRCVHWRKDALGGGGGVICLCAAVVDYSCRLHEKVTATP